MGGRNQAQCNDLGHIFPLKETYSAVVNLLCGHIYFCMCLMFSAVFLVIILAIV